MIYLITSDVADQYAGLLVEMHKLRGRVFKGRLEWDVLVSNDMEIDEFDSYNPNYLIQVDESGRVTGCVRLLPSMGANMLRDVFPVLCHGPAPASPVIWESSRFASDLPADAPKAAGGLAVATWELFAGMIEFGMAWGLTDIVTVTDIRMERILRRAGWPFRRVGDVHDIGNTRAVAGLVETSAETLATVRAGGGFDHSVLVIPEGVAVPGRKSEKVAA